jgi:hypothetical protein
LLPTEKEEFLRITEIQPRELSEGEALDCGEF